VNPADWTGPAAYVIVFLAAALEGEIVFVTAAVLVGQGRLDPTGVVVAGALGAALGDQFYFYALRGRLRGWLDRYPRFTRGRDVLVERVRHHQTWFVLAIRFSPGFRIALAAACAYAGVSGWRYSTLNGLTAIVWAAGLLWMVASLGPAWLPRLGLSGWWAAIVPAVLIVVALRWAACVADRRLEAGTGQPPVAE
jgi:membrane protein DedA with SNARE-associated domain